MSLGIRGSNPIWTEFDLQGHLFDDTFYLFVLENTIPYIPATVYHDPDLNTAWTNPIQFLGNGTLPVDIYFETDVVYRLEFRQGPTQADPLIYEINNYVAGAGGSTPVDTVAFASSNQITNPQFALISFSSPLTISATNPDPIEIGPGWFLNLTGTGSLTLTQVPLDSTTPNPSNAPYALRLQLTGWDADGVVLRQRFEQNGMLWANKIISSAITARVQGAPQSIDANLVDSNGTTLANVINDETVNGTFNEFTGYGTLPDSTNPDVPPAAYIDYLLTLPSTVDIYISSIQLVVQEIPIEPTFEQDSINRQIDHTYNTAYPIVPVGTIIDFGGFNTPSHYLLCDGAAYNRTAYNLLFQSITTTETVTLTATSNTFTVASGARYRIGMGVENAAIPANTTIIAIATNTITISSPATVTGSTSVRFFAAARTYTETVSLTNAVATFTVASTANYAIGMAITGAAIQSNTVIANIVGLTITMSKTATATQSSLLTFYSGGNGNGTTTFNVYNLQDHVIAGAGGSLFGAGLTGLGARGGDATHTLTIAEMPAHTHPGVSASFGLGIGMAGGAGAAIRNIGGYSMSVATQGDGNPHSIVQQTVLMKKLIRYE